MERSNDELMEDNAVDDNSNPNEVMLFNLSALLL